MSKTRIWINTHVEWVWNGSQYVEVVTEGYWYEGPLDLLHNNPSTDQEIYRWRDDDGTNETNGTWLAAANNTYDFDVSSGNVDARLRFSVAENGGADETSRTYPLEFQINGGTWNVLGAATTGCIYYDSTKLTNGNNTTEQLAGPGTFQSSNGGQCEDGTVDAFVLSANADVEFEYTIRFVAADLDDGASLNFRVQSLDAYTVTANATISKLNNYSLACDSGSYSVTGTAASLVSGKKVTADSGSYSITGTDVAFTKGYNFTADSGSYSVQGTDTAFLVNYAATADSGSYSVTGTDAALNVNYTLAADSGSYTVNGTDIALFTGYSVTAESGSYAVTGTDATGLVNYVIPAESGSYSVTGTDVVLTYTQGSTYSLAAESGSYSVTGTDVSLSYTQQIDVAEYARSAGLAREYERIEKQDDTPLQEDEEVILFILHFVTQAEDVILNERT